MFHRLIIFFYSIVKVFMKRKLSFRYLNELLLSKIYLQTK